MNDIVLDLPAPISVNTIRRFDFSASKKLSEWKKHADQYVLAAKRHPENPVRLERIARFEIEIVLHEDHVKIDADNSAKHLIDYLRMIEVIENDAPKNLRKLTVMWGHAPAGCRVTVKPLPTSVNDVLEATASRLEATQA